MRTFNVPCGSWNLASGEMVVGKPTAAFPYPLSEEPVRLGLSRLCVSELSLLPYNYQGKSILFGQVVIDQPGRVCAFMAPDRQFILARRGFIRPSVGSEQEASGVKIPPPWRLLLSRYTTPPSVPSVESKTLNFVLRLQQDGSFQLCGAYFGDERPPEPWAVTFPGRARIPEGRLTDHTQEIKAAVQSMQRYWGEEHHALALGCEPVLCFGCGEAGIPGKNNFSVFGDVVTCAACALEAHGQPTVQAYTSWAGDWGGPERINVPKIWYTAPPKPPC